MPYIPNTWSNCTLTLGQRRARTEMEREWRRVAAEVARGSKRAMDLLHEYLTPEQKLSLKLEGCFDVAIPGATSRARNHYVRLWSSGRVALLDQWKHQRRALCINSDGHVGDKLLACLLMVTNNPKKFVRFPNGY